jgi:aspartate kinase
MMIIQKYGGSSLADANKIRHAAQRVSQQVLQGHQLVVVVSAQGDTTDLLLKNVSFLSRKPNPRELDAYLTTGEQLSAALMAMVLEDMGIPAISLTGWQAGLLTDSNYGDAQILSLTGDRISRELAQGKTVVVAGFQGVDTMGNITTLGRGGSDTTAVALAAFLGADRCQIYTDVDGVYDRDPRKYPDAVKYDTISYSNMLRLAKQGAQVLHHRCVELAMAHHVKLEVLSSFRPGKGTTVTDNPEIFPQQGK